MFNKVLVANRGEIAVRIVRACRDLGIKPVAVYDPEDRSALHVRLAAEAYPLTTAHGYHNAEAMLAIAEQAGVDAVHPGYGTLAEHVGFVRACEERGIVFVGPTAAALEQIQDKVGTIERVRAAGILTARPSSRTYGTDEFEAMQSEIESIGYPVIIKSAVGGRGRSTYVAGRPAELQRIVQRAQQAALAVHGDARLYFEAAILPSRHVEVSLIGDHHGNLVHLGERDVSIQRNHQRIVAEAPSPSLTQAQRDQIWEQALSIGRLLNCRSACNVEFVIDADGQPFFTEIKPRLQVEHSVTEMHARIDVVREQLEVAAGHHLGYRQEDLRLNGVAIQCRINAEDPWNNYLPSPGRLDGFRTPGGPGVRVDTYAYAGCEVPVHHESLLAKLLVWGDDREECLSRLRRALHDFDVRGVQTNLTLLQQITEESPFQEGTYTTDFGRRKRSVVTGNAGAHLRDLVAVVAVAYMNQRQARRPSTPQSFQTGWYRDSRNLPR
jgi:acetyl-CoA carboxylase biotin carboxylase subunit